MTRTLTATAIALLLAASGVFAQAPAEQPRYRTESQWSPLTYEYLGATPKADLSRLFVPKAAKVEASKAAAEKAANSAKPAQADVAHARAPQGKTGDASSTH